MSFEIPLISITINNHENCRTVNGKTLQVEPEVEESSSSEWEDSVHEDEDDLDNSDSTLSLPVAEAAASKKPRVWNRENINCVVITSNSNLFKRARLDSACSLIKKSASDSVTSKPPIKESPFINLLKAFPCESKPLKLRREGCTKIKEKATIVEAQEPKINELISIQQHDLKKNSSQIVTATSTKYLQAKNDLGTSKTTSPILPSSCHTPSVAVISPRMKLQVPNDLKPLDTNNPVSAFSDAPMKPVVTPTSEKDLKKVNHLNALHIHKEDTLSVWTNLGKKNTHAPVVPIHANGLKSSKEIKKQLFSLGSKQVTQKEASSVVPSITQELRTVLTPLKISQISSKRPISSVKESVEQKETESTNKHLKVTNDLINAVTTKRSTKDISEFLKPLPISVAKKNKSILGITKKQTPLISSSAKTGPRIPPTRNLPKRYKIPKRNSGSATIVDLNDISKDVDVPLDDDLISLHPNDCLLSDLELENDNSNIIQLPKQRSIPKIAINIPESRKNAAIVKPLYQPTHERAEAVVNRNESYKNSNSIVGDVHFQPPKKTTFCSNETEVTSTVLAKDILAARAKDKDYYLNVANICRKYDKCPNTEKCGYIHNIYHGSLVTINLPLQEAFLNEVLEMNIPALTQDILKNLPIALAESNNNILLLKMIGRVIKLEIFDRTQPIKDIIDGMMSMPRLKFKYEQVVNMIFQRYGYIPLLSDIIVSITVDRPSFMKHWNILQEIFIKISHQLDHYVVQKILDEFNLNYLDSSVAEAVQNVLISKKLYDKTKIKIPIAYMSKLPSAPQSSTSAGTSLVHNISDTNCNISKLETPVVKVSSSTLPFSFLECTNVEKCCRFLVDNHSKLPTINIFGGFVQMFKSLNPLDYNKYTTFTNEVFLETVKLKVEPNLVKTVIQLAVNLLTFFYHWNSKGILKKGICLLQVLESRSEYLDQIEFYYEINIESGLIILFKGAVLNASYDLAIAIFKSSKFKFPDKGSFTYPPLCVRMRYFIKVMAQANQLVLIKDLLIHIIRNKILDIKDLYVKDKCNKDLKEENVDIFECYRTYVKGRYEMWENISEFMFDLDDSIYELYPHLKDDILRNVLILMYRNLSLVPFTKFLEMYESCQSFYRQIEKGIFYNCYLTMTEIHFVTHIFIYKSIINKITFKAVKKSYGRAFQEEQPPPPIFFSSQFWDFHTSIQERVRYALGNFPIHVINPKESEISEKLQRELSKFIIQHERGPKCC